MIPERIYVAGFLCYREPQEIIFRGCALWLLAGANGSGKSAVFDAMTFALFAQHRGGKQNSRSLIHQASDRLVVEFDFELEQQIYRARRTLARNGKSTRQMLQPDIQANGPDKWLEIADTQREAGFRSWIRDHVGLTYEAFTTSVLLLQGRSEQLLQAPPAERHDLLAQIVGLDRYRELEQFAKARRSRLEGAAAKLRSQVAEVPAVSKRQLSLARRRTSTLQEQSRELTAKLEELHRRVVIAEQQQHAQQKSSELRRQRDALAAWLGNEKQIERDFQRWQYLDSHLSDLATLVQRDQQINDLTCVVDQLASEKSKLKSRLAGNQPRVGRAQGLLDQIVQQLETLAAESEQLARRRANLAHVAQLLRRLRESFERLGHAEITAQMDQRRLDEAIERRNRLRGQAPPSMTLQAAVHSRERAAEDSLHADLILQQARQRLERFGRVANAELCEYCQQPLPKELVEQLQAKLECDRREAEQAARGAAAVLSDADRQAIECEERQRKTMRLTHELDGQIAALMASAPGSRSLRDEAKRCYEETLQELPADLQERALKGAQIDTQSTFPFSDDIDQSVRETQDVQSRAEQLEVQVKTRRQKAEQLRTWLKHERAERTGLQKRLEQLESALAQHQVELTHHEEAAAALRRNLPDPWQSWSGIQLTKQLSLLERELAAFSVEDVQSRWRSLCDAKSNAFQLSIRIDELAEAEPVLPEPLSLGQLTVARDECRSQLETSNESVRAEEREQADLQASVAKRDSLLDDLRETERAAGLWKRLAQLLGRDRLQRCLMKNAEREIVDFANVLLDRLSAGTIYLEHRGNREGGRGSAAVLDLQARADAADGEPLDLAFLSGSQRFRVAISLALAIGQYASHARRPVQAVIIDEGFGCLDATNRQVMIQELHNLRRHLQRILLVSHQEEFVEAFADGYICQRIEGTSRVTAFHR